MRLRRMAALQVISVCSRIRVEGAPHKLIPAVGLP